MTILFISDLHLTPNRPDITQCFMEFMQSEAIHAEALYVLGDLFEFWVGDDDNNPFNQNIKQAFKSLTSAGIPCYFTQGNRDFLVGKRFARETGVIILDELSVIDLYGEKALVLHGDTLCTDDHKYLAYREKVHQPWLQWVYNRLPLFIKKKIVSKVQSDIGEEKKEKSLDIMDVNQAEVERVMAQYDCKLMIHGHTHRPAIHTFEHNKRIVLGDWYTQGSVLVVTKENLDLQNRDFT
ncbi:UDP-2,3-diacylglucosamine diphosphatase [Vibrio hannami]|uniref:UDP-2,3-diacylglucosamine diphosphatase n=1 Tax=Vibrio hannami TaxID=2717094 RepID=UPI0024106124|nr:UDP-2,3-diacylglucosamine diphosphatase [Vibrio hannami]MDG3087699.1 UDP-2,3-diacylglucosamine diphosphatase [Vibrio hannami]